MSGPDLGSLAAPLGSGGQTAPGGAATPSADPTGQAPGGLPPSAPEPATAQPEASGDAALGHAQMQIARSIMTNAIAKFPTGSREQTAIMDLLKKMSREFSGTPATPQLAQSETQMLQSSANQTGSANLNP